MSEELLLPCSCGALPRESMDRGVPFYSCSDPECVYSSMECGKRAWNRYARSADCLRQRAERVEAEVERLREALNAVKTALDRCPSYMCEAVRKIRKALGEGK